MARSEDAHEGTRIDRSDVTLYNLPRLRTDVWNRLRDVARRLARVKKRSEIASTLKRECADGLDFLETIECFAAFPGRALIARLRELFDRAAYEGFARLSNQVAKLLATNLYRKLDLTATTALDYVDALSASRSEDPVPSMLRQDGRPFFEVLVVDEHGDLEEAALKKRLRALRRDDDQFIYEVVVVTSFEDALLASLVNFNLEACVLRNTFPFPTESAWRDSSVRESVYALLDESPEALREIMPGDRTLVLGQCLRRLRPELDLYLVTDASVERVAGESGSEFRRLFYQQDDFQDLHLSVLKGVHARHETPFFNALRAYSQKPTGMFHALPISRGRTISKSHWIGDMGKFYGSNLFLAETSATTGGLDSLLQPTGSLKRAQELAARAFGSRRTYFVTNGTSTANKVVMQALMRPGDIVLLAHDCHKSHPYAVILAGATPVYLDAYPLTEYSMYGGVPVREIKRQLLELRDAGKLDRVRMLLLTNITFDGITYDPLRVMQEVLAIKPDMIFVWDEAWFAYGRFSPTIRQRTAMHSADRLLKRLDSPKYRAEYEAWKKSFDARVAKNEDAWLEERLLPDPDRAKVRVYATQSTHKTLTALRQGSMIHVHDQSFEQDCEEAFHEAYMTHTSTSPNYQILASLDVGRRQVELEGYELVQRSLELAMTLRERVTADPLLSKYFHVLGPSEMVPEEHRPSGLEYYFDPARGWSHMEEAWRDDEFVLDPTRVTLHVGRTGMDGDTFKKLLMDRHDIHINKTSRNSLLFMIHIGMNRGTIAQLVSVLTRVAKELDDTLAHQSPANRRSHERRVKSLTEELPPLPNFSRFHRAFLSSPDSTTSEGNMRDAFFLSYRESHCHFLPLERELQRKVEAGLEVVSARFVTPYPPGFPVLVPGQIVTAEILEYLLALDVKEIHGFDSTLGLRVFTEACLNALEGTDSVPSRTVRLQEESA